MNKFNIVIVSSGTLDTLFVLKILDKFKSQNILLITERNIPKEILSLVSSSNLELLKLNKIYFSYEFKIIEYKQLSKIFLNCLLLWKLKKKINKKTRFYYFNEFYSFCTFLSYSFFKKNKNLFIRSIRFLEVKNFNLINIFKKNFTFKKKLKIILNYFFLSFLFKEIKFAFYQLDPKYFKKEYKEDYYKVEGFGFSEKYRYFKIKPFNIKNNKKIISKKPLYLFAPLEQTSNYGLDLNKTYENIFSYMAKNFEEIDVKIHPTLKDSQWLKKLSQKVKINYLSGNLPAEYYLLNYDSIFVNFVSNSIKHYLENRNNYEKKFYSFINLVEFEHPMVKAKFYQMFDVVYCNFEKKIIKVLKN
jgi:hypothetical protein